MRTAMMAMTTSSSISVNARRRSMVRVPRVGDRTSKANRAPSAESAAEARNAAAAPDRRGRETLVDGDAITTQVFFAPFFLAPFFLPFLPPFFLPFLAPFLAPFFLPA